MSFDPLFREGFQVIDQFLPDDLFRALVVEHASYLRENKFRPAGVGRTAQSTSARSDEILWLDDSMGAGKNFLREMENLRNQLRAAGRLPLVSGEFHYAFYREGSSYERHLDAFHDSRKSPRQISFVLYLNSDWRPEDGGELRLHLDGATESVVPLANRAVLFASAQISHEVCVARRPRSSIAGWFKST